eukprot:1156367-Pelagomonas_calceolata.AAC.4
MYMLDGTGGLWAWPALHHSQKCKHTPPTTPDTPTAAVQTHAPWTTHAHRVGTTHYLDALIDVADVGVDGDDIRTPIIPSPELDAQGLVQIHLNKLLLGAGRLCGLRAGQVVR